VRGDNAGAQFLLCANIGKVFCACQEFLRAFQKTRFQARFCRRFFKKKRLYFLEPRAAIDLK